MDDPKLGKAKGFQEVGEKVDQVEAVFGQYWRLPHAVDCVMI